MSAKALRLCWRTFPKTILEFSLYRLTTASAACDANWCLKAAGKASEEGRIVPEPDENPHADPTEKGTFRDRKLLTGVDLKKWRTKKHLSRAEASKILGIGMSSIARAEKLRKHSLGPQLAPALSKALGR